MKLKNQYTHLCEDKHVAFVRIIGWSITTIWCVIQLRPDSNPLAISTTLFMLAVTYFTDLFPNIMEVVINSKCHKKYDKFIYFSLVIFLLIIIIMSLIMLPYNSGTNTTVKPFLFYFSFVIAGIILLFILGDGFLVLWPDNDDDLQEFEDNHEDSNDYDEAVKLFLDKMKHGTLGNEEDGTKDV